MKVKPYWGCGSERKVGITWMASGDAFEGDGSIFIGTNSSNGIEFQGIMDELKMFNIALTEEEILFLYQSGPID